MLSTEDIKALIKTVAAELITEFSARLDQRFDQLNARIATMSADLASRDKRIADLHDENNRLKADMSALQLKNDELEGYSRRDNLILTGIPATTAEVAGANNSSDSSSTLVKKVIDVVNHGMNLQLKPEDISTAHRLPSRNSGSSQPGSVSTSAVIVRFVRRCVRDDVFRAKRALKTANLGFRLFVNEDLSPHTQKIFHGARFKLRNKLVQGAWTMNGKVYVKSNSGQTTHIKSLNELNNFQ